jgi:hypothetical protein
MRVEREALRLGLSIVSAKLAQAMGVPGLNAINQPPYGAQPMGQGVVPGMAGGITAIDQPDLATESDAELPTTGEQIRDRSAKIAPGRVISPQ